MVRAFTAVDINDEDVLGELKRIQEQIDLGFNLMDPSQMHITLRFFQDASEDEIEKIIETMQEVDKKPFKVEIKGMGAFPSKEHIRVVWAGAEDPEVYELHRKTGKHGVESDTDNEFKPHVTLARVEDISRDKKKKLQRVLKEFEEQGFGEIEVGSLKLYRSDLKPSGVSYTEIEEVEL